MTEFLLKLASGKNVGREVVGRAAGLLGIISNSIISLLKLVVGLISGNIAIFADGINNLSDAVSSVVTMVGFHMSQKPADTEHPYGHARMEYIAGLTVSFIVIFIGIQLTSESVNRILNPVPTEHSTLAIVVMIFSILVKLWQIFLFRSVGKKINSSTLMATAIDSRNDIFAGIAVLVSIPLSDLVGFSLDGYAGLAVALFIIYSGIGLVKETSAPLLGAPPNDEMTKGITEEILATEGILGVHDLIVHSYGECCVFASAHVEMSADGNLLASHEIIDRLEYNIHERWDVNLTLHLDPVVKDERVDELKAVVKRLASEISPQLQLHDFRVVFTPGNSKIMFDLTLPPNLKIPAKQLRKQLTQNITSSIENSTVIIIIERHFTDVHR